MCRTVAALCGGLVPSACTDSRTHSIWVAGYRHRDKGEPAVFKLESAASSELSASCRALAMQVALRTCRAADFSAAIEASGCPRESLSTCSHGAGSSGDSWEWLVGVGSDAPCSVVDVSDESAHVLGFFGSEKDDNTCSWDIVCAGLVATALPEELSCAFLDRSELEFIGVDRSPMSLHGTSNEQL